VFAVPPVEGNRPISDDFPSSRILQLCRFKNDLGLRNRTVFEFHPSLISAKKCASEAFQLSSHFENCFYFNKIRNVS